METFTTTELAAAFPRFVTVSCSRVVAPAVIDGLASVSELGLISAPSGWDAIEVDAVVAAWGCAAAFTIGNNVSTILVKIRHGAARTPGCASGLCGA
jgi:hypothetical protein